VIRDHSEALRLLNASIYLPETCPRTGTISSTLLKKLALHDAQEP
jgi:hypothetical protein